MSTNIIALPIAEKSPERLNAEKCIAKFISCIHDVNRAGQMIGRENLMLDFVCNLTSVAVYAENGLIEEIVGLPDRIVNTPDKTKRRL